MLKLRYNPRYWLMCGRQLWQVEVISLPIQELANIVCNRALRKRALHAWCEWLVWRARPARTLCFAADAHRWEALVKRSHHVRSTLPSGFRISAQPEAGSQDGTHLSR